MPIVCISHNSPYNRLVEFCLLDDDASKVMRNESKGTLVMLPAGVSLGLHVRSLRLTCASTLSLKRVASRASAA